MQHAKALVDHWTSLGPMPSCMDVDSPVAVSKLTTTTCISLSVKSQPQSRGIGRLFLEDLENGEPGPGMLLTIPGFGFGTFF